MNSSVKILHRFNLSIIIIVMLGGGLAYARGLKDVYLDQGISHAVQGNFTASKKALARALKIDPSYLPAKNGLVVINDVLSNKIKRQAAIHIFRASMHNNKGDFDNSIREYTSAIAINPGYALTYQYRGTLYAIKGQHDRAIADFTKAIAINPNYAAAYLNRGNRFAIKGQTDRAIMDFTKAITINPKYALAYYNRGLAYGKKARHKREILDYSKAIEINPKFALAYYNRGTTYGDLGQYNLAIADYTKAIAIKPNYAKAYDNRGYIYMVKLKNKKKACSDWKKACEIGKCVNYHTAKRKGDCQ